MNKKFELITAITDFITQDNDRAFQIDGRWGTGKTYFIKNELFGEIKKIGYVPIMISMSGISSYESIIDKINIEIIKSADQNNISSKTMNLISTLSNNLQGFKLKGIDVNKTIKKLVNEAIIASQKSDFIIILDDFERSNLSYKDLYEYTVQIQTQYENNLIIVSSEKDIENNTESIIDAKLKEKIICRTFKFENYDNKNVAIKIINNKIQDMIVCDKYKKWMIKNISSLIDISDYINLRTLIDYLSTLQIIIKHLDSSNDNDTIFQAIKTASMACYGLSFMIKNIDNKSLENQTNEFIDETSRSITFINGIKNNSFNIESVKNSNNNEHDDSCIKYLIENFHNKIVEYDRNAAYFSELYEVLTNGYFDSKSYIKKITETYIKNDYGLIEKMMYYMVLDTKELGIIQKKSNEKYLRNKEFTQRIDSKYLNYLCIMFSLYNKFSKLDILEVPESTLLDIKNKIITVLKSDKLYNPTEPFDVASNYYNEFISEIDEDKSINKVIENKKREINDSFAIKIVNEMISRIVVTNKYNLSFIDLHLFKLLADENILNKICTVKGCCYFLDENIKRYVINNNLVDNASNVIMDEAKHFKISLNIIENKIAKDRIIKLNINQLNETLSKLINI